jgi:hypothetical protein
VWAAPANERTLDDLIEKVQALSETHDSVPPLDVVDDVEGGSVAEPLKGAQPRAQPSATPLTQAHSQRTGPVPR